MSVGVGEVDVAGAVRCGPVRARANHQPPVEERGEAPDGLVERAARQPPDHRHLVGDEVLELRAVCAQHRGGVVVTPRDDPHDAVVDRERPRVAVDVDDELAAARTRQRQAQGDPARVERRRRQHLLEARDRVDRVDLTVHTSANVDPHAVLPRIVSSGTSDVVSEHGKQGIGERRALVRALGEVSVVSGPPSPRRAARTPRRSLAAHRGRSRRARPRCRRASARPRRGARPRTSARIASRENGWLDSLCG